MQKAKVLQLPERELHERALLWLVVGGPVGLPEVRLFFTAHRTFSAASYRATELAEESEGVVFEVRHLEWCEPGQLPGGIL